MALGAGVSHLPRSPAPTPEASVGTALASARGADRTARSTESVRYDDRALTVLDTYVIDGGALRDEARTARDADVWAVVRATLPADAVAQVRQLNLVTDGHDGTLAMVHRSTLDPTAWVLSIDPAEDEDVLVSTLVHEYGHMLTLGPTDLLSVAASRNGCAGVRIEIGCALEGSALAEWHAEFWAGDATPAARDLVSEYAGTSVHEDLAESFMSWVLDDQFRPTAGVQGRYAFFASRSQFVAARDEVRAKLAR